MTDKVAFLDVSANAEKLFTLLDLCVSSFFWRFDIFVAEPPALNDPDLRDPDLPNPDLQNPNMTDPDLPDQDLSNPQGSIQTYMEKFPPQGTIIVYVAPARVTGETPIFRDC